MIIKNKGKGINMFDFNIHEVMANINLTLFFQSIIMLFIHSYRFENYLFSKPLIKIVTNFVLFFVLYCMCCKLNLLSIEINPKMYTFLIGFTGLVSIINYTSILSKRFYFRSPVYYLISVIILFIILMSYYHQI